MKNASTVLCLLVLLLTVGAVCAQNVVLQPDDPYTRALRSPGTQDDSPIPGPQAVTHGIAPDYFNYFYAWMVKDDVSKFTHYQHYEYVCVNYSVQCLAAAYQYGFKDIYACRIQNFEGRGGHFVVAAWVNPGTIFWNTNDFTDTSGKQIYWPGGWILVDPQNDEMLNVEMANYAAKGIQQNITMFTSNGFVSKYWTGGGLHDDVDPQCVVADFTVDSNGQMQPLNRYFNETTIFLDTLRGSS